MAKVKTVPDPDADREKVNGPMPPTADDALSGEQEVRVDEQRGVYTQTARGDDGTLRIAVLPLPGLRDTGGPPRAPGIRTVAESIHDEQARVEDLQRQAREDIVPAVETWKMSLTCSLFTGRGGHGEAVGQLTWCQGEACPAWKGPACCSMGAVGTRELLVGRVQPASREELEELLKIPGNRLAADTEDRVQARIAEIMAERAAASRAEAATVADRDQAILDARQEQRRQPVIQFVRPGTSIGEAQREAKKRLMGG